MHPLLGPRLKIAIAHAKIEQFKAEISALDGSKLPPFTVKYDPKTGKNTVFVKTRQLTKPEWSILVGEICYHLRSALDGIVYQLGILNGVSPEDIGNTGEFPIFERPRTNHFGKGFWDELPRKLKHVDRKHWAKFEPLQPYKRGNRGKRCPLWQLHALNNADKHRFIPILAFSPHRMNVYMLNVVTGVLSPLQSVKHSRRMRNLESGTEITLGIRGPRGPNVRVKLHLFIDVRFGKGNVRPLVGKGVVQTVTEAHQYVTAIYNEFSPLFPPWLGWPEP